METIKSRPNMTKNNVTKGRKICTGIRLSRQQLSDLCMTRLFYCIMLFIYQLICKGSSQKFNVVSKRKFMLISLIDALGPPASSKRKPTVLVVEIVCSRIEIRVCSTCSSQLLQWLKLIKTDTLVYTYFSNQRRQACSKSMNEPFDPPPPCNEFPFARAL